MTKKQRNITLQHIFWCKICGTFEAIPENLVDEVPFCPTCMYQKKQKHKMFHVLGDVIRK